MPLSSSHKNALPVLALLPEHQYSHLSKLGAETLSCILCIKTVRGSTGWVLEALEFCGWFGVLGVFCFILVPLLCTE